MNEHPGTECPGSDEPRTSGWLVGGGQTGELIRQKDWSATPLGPIEGWPAELRTAVQICLHHDFPMWVAWGPDFIQIYNDASLPLVGEKHPEALGEPVAQWWGEIWSDVGPSFQAAFERGETASNAELRMDLARHGPVEEAYFANCFSPIPGRSGEPGGALITVFETTDKVIAARRIAVLRDLGAATAGAGSPLEVCQRAGSVLAEHTADVPCGLVYLAEAGDRARTVSGWGLPDSVRGWPEVRLDDPAPALPLGRARTQGTPVLLDRLEGFPVLDRPEGLPGPAAVVLPVCPAGVGSGPAAFLVVAIPPRRRLDGAHRAFLDLLAGQLTAAVAAAHSYESARRTAEQLAELDRAKTAFFSNVSHEFRTPLTLMMGPVADLRAAAAEAGTSSAGIELDRWRAELDVVHRNGLRLGKLVTGLLDFARIQAGRVQAAYQPVDLTAVTGELAAVFRSAMQRAGLSFTVDCADIGQPVFLDPEMWEKIVLNLLSNAVKYTLTGSVTVTLRREDDVAVLRVADTGVGVPAPEMDQLFERFHRASTAHTRSTEGSGIGLALTKELVELHGGTISAHSDGAETGTTFTVALPLGSAHLPADRVRASGVSIQPQSAEPFVAEAMGWLLATDEPPVTAPAAPAGRGAPGWTPAGRLLVADDNADMGDYLRRLLSPPYTVELVADGQAALDAALADPPDLVLADVMMPRLDGLALVAALRADPATAAVPVVLLSARAGQEAAVGGLAAGADDYLVKPFSSTELLARVRAHLDLARGRVGESRRMRALADAVIEINGADGVPETLDRLTRAARELIGARWAAAGLAAEQGEARVARSSSVSPTQGGGSDDIVALAGLVERVYADDVVLRLTRAEVADHPGWNGVVGRRPPDGWLGAPLTGGGGANLGVVWLADREVGEFTVDDVAILVQLAAAASTVLEKARLLEQQTEIARTLQRAILGPATLPEPFAARYEPAPLGLEVGGDWYDLVALPAGRFGLVVGDVVGRGLTAAAVMGQLRSAVRALLVEGHGPGQVLTELDGFARMIPQARCCTVFCALIDPAAGTVRYASAGHPPAILVEGAGSRLLMDARSVPLCVGTPARRPESEAALAPGATLLLYTDGLVERPDQPIRRGIDRLTATLRAHAQLPPADLADLLADQQIGTDRDDDVTFLLYRQPPAAVPDPGKAGRNADAGRPPTASPMQPVALAPSRQRNLTLPGHGRNARTDLRITHTEHRGTVTVAVAGGVDLFTADRFERAIAAAAATTRTRLLLDLTAVTHLSSAGVKILFDHLEDQPEIVVADASVAANVLTMTGLEDLVQVHVSEPR